MVGLYKWLFKYKSIWGEMLRTASWTGKILSETVAIDSEKHEAVPHSLQSNATGIPLLREEYNWLFKTESRWGKKRRTVLGAGEFPYQGVAAIDPEKQKSIPSSLPKYSETAVVDTVADAHLQQEKHKD